MAFLYGFRNLRQGLTRLSRGQKLLTGAMAVVVLITWLAVCALLVSFFV
jgi:hypothetical protein